MGLGIGINRLVTAREGARGTNRLKATGWGADNQKGRKPLTCFVVSGRDYFLRVGFTNTGELTLFDKGAKGGPAHEAFCKEFGLPWPPRPAQNLPPSDKPWTKSKQKRMAKKAREANARAEALRNRGW